MGNTCNTCNCDNAGENQPNEFNVDVRHNLKITGPKQSDEGLPLEQRQLSTGVEDGQGATQ